MRECRRWNFLNLGIAPAFLLISKTQIWIQAEEIGIRKKQAIA
ncbi:hypothetical protein [Dendronalium phyllosphericum]|nr:hypothetical protein [Dendronalium phyllosphericum]